MKKRILVFIALAIISFMLLFLDNNRKTANDSDDMIKIARNVIPISDADTIDIQIIGSVDNEKRSLVYFMTGNEYQSHSYFPLEFQIIPGDKYKFERMYKPMNRGMDISVLSWKEGYAFVVNNSKCKKLQITSADGKIQMIEVGNLPFLYYFKEIPAEYDFLDSDGNVMY